jgi:integrase
MLARNPADAVDLPKARRREMRVLDETATAALLSVAKGTSLYVPVLVAVSTGLRRGELLGLKWQDVDLDGGALSVVRVLAEAGGELTFKEPKTAKSRRLVSLGPTVVDVLRQHRREQVEARLQFGAAFNPEGLVFATADGEPLTPSTFSVAFRRLAGRAGFAGLRLHDLRHTHATQLAGAGVLPKVISERLGHASIGITMDLYAHVMPGMQEDAVARHDAVLAQALAAAESAEAATLGTKMAPIAPFGPQ